MKLNKWKYCTVNVQCIYNVFDLQFVDEVMFLSREHYFIHKRQIKQTLRIMKTIHSQYSD